MSRTLSITAVVLAVAACKSSSSEPPPAPKATEPAPAVVAVAAEPPPPALVDLDVSSAGKEWEGLVIKAPAGSKAKGISSVGFGVIGPDGSGWAIEVLAKDFFDSAQQTHRAKPTFLSAEVAEADRYIGTDSATASLSNYKVLVRTKVADRVFTCQDYRVISSRALANSYAEACASLRTK